jgi:alpha-1,2-mannosyltransferase
MPALFLLIGRALEIRDRTTRLRHLGALSGVYVVMCSSLVWLWYSHPSGWASFAGSNAYVWITIGLLVAISWPQIRASSPVDLRMAIRQRV